MIFLTYKKSTQESALDVTLSYEYIQFNTSVHRGDVIEVRTTAPNASYILSAPTNHDPQFVDGVARFTAEYNNSYFSMSVWDSNNNPINLNQYDTQVVRITESSEKYATESYVDSAVSGKQDTLTFGYDSSDKINAINGSAIAGGSGGGHEYSGANGVYVDNENEVIGLDTSASNAIETVIENSGAWGGAGLPISAGPGIKVALENGVLMISNDETVLFENSAGTSAFTTSEPISNFERVRFYINSNPLATISEVVVPMMGNNLNKIELSWNDYWKDEGNFHIMNWQSKINNTGMSAFSISATYYMGTNANNASDNGQYYPRSGTTEFAPWFYKVVGIGRKSN